MKRAQIIDFAKQKPRMPIVTDLVLQEHADHPAICRDGARLGQVVAESSRRYKTPFAIPIMDLTVEKDYLTRLLDVPETEWATWHFTQLPAAETMPALLSKIASASDPRMNAMAQSLRWISANTKLIPVGMVIGPFSLMTKLLADPITAVYIAGTGVTGADDPEIALLEKVMELSLAVVLRNMRAQIAAGAKMIFVAEPAGAANYISPIQMAEGSDVFSRFVIGPNLRLKAELTSAGVEMFLHICGDLPPEMLHEVCIEIHPTSLSVGATCNIWEHTAVVPKDVVLYGNLPSKKFYSDQLVSIKDVEDMTRDLAAKMSVTGHPFILGTECYVMSVPGAQDTIKRKIQAILEA